MLGSRNSRNNSKEAGQALAYFDHDMNRVNRWFMGLGFVGTLLGKILDAIIFSLVGMDRMDLLMDPSQFTHWFLMPAMWVIMTAQLGTHIAHLYKARKQGQANAVSYLKFAQHLLMWALVTAAVAFMTVPGLGETTLFGFSAGGILFIGALGFMAVTNFISALVNFYQSVKLSRRGEAGLSNVYRDKAINDLVHALVVSAIVVTAVLTFLNPIGLPVLGFIGVAAAGFALAKLLVPKLIHLYRTRQVARRVEKTQQESVFNALKAAELPLWQNPKNPAPPPAFREGKQGAISFFAAVPRRSSQLRIYRDFLKHDSLYFRVIRQADGELYLQTGVSVQKFESMGALNALYQADLACLKDMINQRNTLLEPKKVRSARLAQKSSAVAELLSIVERLDSDGAGVSVDHARLLALIAGLQDLAKRYPAAFRSSRAVSETGDLLKAALDFARGYALLAPVAGLASVSMPARKTEALAHIGIIQASNLDNVFQGDINAATQAIQAMFEAETEDVFARHKENLSRIETGLFAGINERPGEADPLFGAIEGFRSLQAYTFAQLQRDRGEVPTASPQAPEVLSMGRLRVHYHGIEHHVEVLRPDSLEPYSAARSSVST